MHTFCLWYWYFCWKTQHFGRYRSFHLIRLIYNVSTSHYQTRQCKSQAMADAPSFIQNKTRSEITLRWRKFATLIQLIDVVHLSLPSLRMEVFKWVTGSDCLEFCLTVIKTDRYEMEVYFQSSVCYDFLENLVLSNISYLLY